MRLRELPLRPSATVPAGPFQVHHLPPTPNGSTIKAGALMMLERTWMVIGQMLANGVALRSINVGENATMNHYVITTFSTLLSQDVEYSGLRF
jgi:hypothetical protein